MVHQITLRDLASLGEGWQNYAAPFFRYTKGTGVLQTRFWSQEDQDLFCMTPNRLVIGHLWGKGLPQHPIVDKNWSLWDCDGINLEGGQLLRVDLTRTLLHQSNLFLSRIASSNFPKADMKGSDLSRSVILHSSFDKATLKFAKFREAEVRHCFFRGSKLDRSHWTHSVLENLDFRGATIQYTDFGDANLTLCNFHPGVTFTRFSDTHCHSCQFEGTNENNAFERATIEACTFFGGSLDECLFRKADFFGTTFGELPFASSFWGGLSPGPPPPYWVRETTFQDSNFTNCQFKNVVFSYANFSGVSFRQTTFEGCDFTGVRWDGATFDNFTRQQLPDKVLRDLK